MQIVLNIKKVVSIVMKIILRNNDFHLEQSEEAFPCNCYEFTIKNMVKENGFNQEKSNEFDAFFEKNDYYKSLQYRYEATPKLLKDYQSEPENSNFEKINIEVNRFGKEIRAGIQILHGGYLDKKSFVTTRPLSTTINPQVVFREAERNFLKKTSYDIYINIITVENPCPKAFCFDSENGDFCHEHEILFESGLKLEKISIEKIFDKYQVSDSFENTWTKNVYLMQWTLSRKISESFTK